MAPKKQKTTQQKTVAEKMGYIPRVTAKGLRNGRERLEGWEIPDTVRLGDLKTDGKFDSSKVATWMKENALTGVKWSGVVSLWMAEMLTRILNALFLDNSALRGMERGFRGQTVKQPSDKWYSRVKHAAKKMSQKHPAITSYLLYYTLLFGVAFGGTTAVDGFVNGDDKAKNKKEVVKQPEVGNDDAVPYEEVQGAKVSQELQDVVGVLTVMPTEAGYVQKALDAYWPEIAVALTELETYREKPVVHTGETRATNGLGVTWDYLRGNDGKLVRQACTKNSVVRDKNGNYEQCRMHLEKETIVGVQGAIKGKNNIGDRQVVALVMAGYQRPADMPEIANRISSATTVQEMADAFAYYPGVKKWRAGTLKRRWVCAAYATGWITAQDLMQMDMDAFSTVELSSVYRGGHFILSENTVKHVLERVRGKKNTVYDFLNDFDTGRKVIAQVNAQASRQNGVSIEERLNTVADPVNESMGYLVQADSCYNNNNYVQAIGLYQKAIDVDPDNIEAYSSLALMYIKIGRESGKVSDYQKCIDVIEDLQKHISSQSGVAVEDETLASAHYNAGTAKEAIADIYKQQGKKRKANNFYKAAKMDYEAALHYAEQIGDVRRQNVYNTALKTLEGKLDVKVAFNRGINNIRKTNAKKDVLLYGQTIDVGKDLA